MPGKGKWFSLWLSDRQTILATMIRNLTADLEAGYDYFGRSATSQREQIEAYRTETENRLCAFREMDERRINHWCYYDLVRRGAITP